MLSIAINIPTYSWINPVKLADDLSKVEWSKHFDGISWTDFGKKVSYDTIFYEVILKEMLLQTSKTTNKILM